MESTIGLYKTELIDLHRRAWTGPAEVETATAAAGPMVQRRSAAFLDQLSTADHLEQQYRQTSTTTVEAA